MPHLLDKAFLLLPLAAAACYALGAIGIKAVVQRGVAVMWITCAANVAAAVAFLAFLDWRAPFVLPVPFYPCLLLGLFFFLGQVCTVLSLSRGAVSIATPVLSSKIVMVVFLLAMLLDEPVGWGTWLGGCITVTGVACLQMTDRGEGRGRMGATIGYGLLAAFCFAVFDIMIQHYSARMGFAPFVPCGMLVAAAPSLLIMPRLRSPRSLLGRAGIAYLLLGLFFLTAQALLIISSIGIYGHAGLCNIVYGSRGLWSILLLAAVGRWFGNAELKLRGGYLALRVAGALQIVAAIALTLL